MRLLPGKTEGRAGTGRLGIVVLACVALTAACGQLPGAHHGTLANRGSGATAGSDPASSVPNGENTGPSQPGPGYIVVTVVTKKKAGGVPVVHAGAFDGPDPLRTCPVHGKGYFSDDFGAPRFAGGFHHHQGNDVFAEMGTPIVAPFDGTAVASPNFLGGNGVTVYGGQGYVYNAHLVGYGKLGPVKTGTVIGYVGNTGDAVGGPYHDHFEWHPNVIPNQPWVSPYGFGAVNGAVDPYPYLAAVCR